MAVYSTAVANAMLDAIETAIGASPTLVLFDAAQPANTTAADVGTVLAELTLPANFFSDASARQKALLGTWRDVAANAAGTPLGFAIKQGATVHMRGSASATGGGGEITFSGTPFVVGQQIDVTSFTLSLP